MNLMLFFILKKLKLGLNTSFSRLIFMALNYCSVNFVLMLKGFVNISFAP
jgi:hypothetical protein